MRRGPTPDLYHAATVTADALAELWGGAGVATLMAWGEPAEIEVLYCRGLQDGVCQALATAAGRKLVDALRRRGEPVTVQADRLGRESQELQTALVDGGVPGLLLVPMPAGFGATGVVCVELQEPALAAGNLADGALGLAQVERVSRTLAALTLAGASSALAVALSEDEGPGGSGVDGIVVLDRWERVIFNFGLLEERSDWSGRGPFGRAADGLPGGSLLAELPCSDPGKLVWEEHLLPPVEDGIPVAAAAVPFARRAEEAHGRIVFLRDLRSGSPSPAYAGLLELALRAASELDAAVPVDQLEAAGPDAPMSRRFDAFLGTLARLTGDVSQRIADALERSRAGADQRSDLNEILERTLRAREREFLNEGVRVLRFLRPELTAVPGDPVSLQHILAGLLEHARESLRPGGGTLTVRTWEENGEVFLAVSDDGRGVAYAEGAEAFQPLYTELDPGSREEHFIQEARESVRPWSGRLMVESRPGLWNRITLMLPGARVAPNGESAKERKGTAKSPKLPPAVRVQKGEMGLEVLVVDDNPSLRSVMRRYLERRGHTVTEAEDGGRALELLGSRAFDRVVVDVKMPGTDGPTFFTSLEDVAPEMRERIIFMTGGFTEHGVESFILSTGRPAIQKPFDLSEMARAVED